MILKIALDGLFIIHSPTQQMLLTVFRFGVNSNLIAMIFTRDTFFISLAVEEFFYKILVD